MQRERPFDVDRGDTRVRMGRAEHGRLEHSGPADVGDELAGAADEPLAAEAGMGGPDRGHGRISGAMTGLHDLLGRRRPRMGGFHRAGCKGSTTRKYIRRKPVSSP
ncbi:MAG: hypothetical protein DMD83_03765 [Candidatus Rokuibacteriota bacterium]|nr:MAG: hypothetical protein DMD83_03765 [Candidatus Rokubacteria bacterium]